MAPSKRGNAMARASCHPSFGVDDLVHRDVVVPRRDTHSGRSVAVPVSRYLSERHSLLSRIIKWRVNRQNPDRGVTVVDFSLMVGLLAIVIIVAVGLGVLGSN